MNENRPERFDLTYRYKSLINTNPGTPKFGKRESIRGQLKTITNKEPDFGGYRICTS